MVGTLVVKGLKVRKLRFRNLHNFLEKFHFLWDNGFQVVELVILAEVLHLYKCNMAIAFGIFVICLLLVSILEIYFRNNFEQLISKAIQKQILEITL